MNVLMAQAADAGAGDVFLWWGIVLGIAAFVLLVMELFIPSAGVLGLLAGIAAISSIVAFWRYDSTAGIGAVAAYIVLTPIVITFVFRIWLNSPLARNMILMDRDEPSGLTEENATYESERRRQERMQQLRELIGTEGRTVTPLRPVGVVKIAGQRVDALAETGIIAASTPVIVVDVYDNQIKVRPADAGDAG